ncbi:MAG: aspartate--tRNA(Asn) ligase [Candidatus Bathyarchaeota archaeon]|nr:aspartate--tRNA(Asn) ligase [Candidatus Bathyarchaeota archaeon]
MSDRVYVEEAKQRPEETVTIAGWVSRTRDLAKIKFIIIRDITGEIQITVKDKDIYPTEGLSREDVIKVTGKAVNSKIANAGVEFMPSKIEVVNRSKQPLPVDITEQTQSELETRLNWRFLDFRNPQTYAIFKIQSRILAAFRGYLSEKDYLELQPPCIISSASEGGADLFSLPYFEKKAFLAQSPQLYKQMAAISFEKVFTVTPIWRAEKFNTPTHLNEVRQMDIEQAFADDEIVMQVLERVLVHIISEVKKHCPEEMKLLKRENLEIPKLPFPRVTYTEAVKMLQSAGETIKWGDDFTKPQERLMMELVGEQAFFLKDWPGSQKAFYSMPYKENPDVVHAFDCIYGGIEISSGTQRIHIPDLLRERIRYKGLNPDNFESYIEAFAYGAPPHAGWSIGLERITMIITGMTNIRECAMFPRDRERLQP